MNFVCVCWEEFLELIDYLFFRLILPYERFIKGEEDKPLPPVKPRKQDNVTQEGESKIKMSGTKRIKNENQKSKKEKENAQKPQDAPEVSSIVPFLPLFSFINTILICSVLFYKQTRNQSS